MTQHDFLPPDPEMVEMIRAELKRQQDERTIRWCEHCKALLREGDDSHA